MRSPASWSVQQAEMTGAMLRKAHHAGSLVRYIRLVPCWFMSLAEACRSTIQGPPLTCGSLVIGRVLCCPVAKVARNVPPGGGHPCAGAGALGHKHLACAAPAGQSGEAWAPQKAMQA
ncbi:hypothetical protein HaLaN_16993 [Haematococcus lacustris]|uniref:Uncharacterized protein n=1 Tax=Haematococcus lacustris TaxID=44745 RepID=A0A699ZDQ3_HAELA|nr:hypothetical protein HaLaN_16993 [Haematococcus lacustris]